MLEFIFSHTQILFSNSLFPFNFVNHLVPTPAEQRFDSFGLDKFSERIHLADLVILEFVNHVLNELRIEVTEEQTKSTQVRTFRIPSRTDVQPIVPTKATACFARRPHCGNPNVLPSQSSDETLRDPLAYDVSGYAIAC